MKQIINLMKLFSVLAIIVGLLLFCRGLKFSVMSDGFSSQMAHHMMDSQGEEMSCCGTNDTGESLMGHTLAAVLPGNIFDMFLAIGLFLFVFAFKRQIGEDVQQLFSEYIRRIRDRYGSAQNFVAVILLFRRGILNPKTY